MFWFAIWVVYQTVRVAIKSIYWVYLAVVYWGGLFVLLHEWLHLFAAKLVGAQCLRYEFEASEEQFSLEFDATLRQIAVINIAPLVLAPLSVAAYYYFFKLSTGYALVLLPIALGLGMAASPSLTDSASVLFSCSVFQPVSSVLATALHLPFLLFNLPSLLFDEFRFVSQILFSVFLALLASPSVSIRSLTHGVPL